tara:strand:+ start:3836 stop:3991 length:156 start_codon:yes stop_codon:yes gene_type:complete
MVIYACVFLLGLMMVIFYPEEHGKLGIILSFGGIMLFGLSIAKQDIDSAGR